MTSASRWSAGSRVIAWPSSFSASRSSWGASVANTEDGTSSMSVVSRRLRRLEMKRLRRMRCIHAAKFVPGMKLSWADSALHTASCTRSSAAARLRVSASACTRSFGRMAMTWSWNARVSDIFRIAPSKPLARCCEVTGPMNGGADPLHGLAHVCARLGPALASLGKRRNCTSYKTFAGRTPVPSARRNIDHTVHHDGSPLFALGIAGRRSGVSHELAELCPGARHPRLHRADRHPTDHRRLVVTELLRTDEHQRLAQQRRQAPEPALQVAQSRVLLLIG